MDHCYGSQDSTKKESSTNKQARRTDAKNGEYKMKSTDINIEMKPKRKTNKQGSRLWKKQVGKQLKGSTMSKVIYRNEKKGKNCFAHVLEGVVVCNQCKALSVTLLLHQEQHSLGFYHTFSCYFQPTRAIQIRDSESIKVVNTASVQPTTDS